ncbi:ATP-binding cassette domain-containing protein [Olivibacter sp. XZL3]|uniref:ATP-binding cassette domain-containing protein n=1 Tax=Olivibacter sp. XZL3 TaxID=1735116 RepID=UPI0010668C1F|nr:ATP-binding cassette domain-containing protein [Olivibacter sp. XZL3]
MKNKLEVDSVLLSYRDNKHILSDCYLACAGGNIIGILGRNGAGKSSLFEVIFGTLTPQNKFIRINGTPYKKPFIKQLVGYLPQKSMFPKQQSVKDLLRFMLAEQRVDRASISNERIRKLWNQHIGELSGGERKYFEVYTMLHMKHPFLLLDEPFSGIEPIYAHEIENLIKQNPRSKGILISDHHYEQVIGVSDKLFLLHDGALKAVHSRHQLEELGYIPAGTF